MTLGPACASGLPPLVAGRSRLGPRCYNEGAAVDSVGPKETPMFGSLGMPEMLIILAILLLIFGANRLPELGRGIGNGIKNFRASMKEGAEDSQK